MNDSSNVSSEAISFGPRRLGHVNLWVGDCQRNTEQYNKVFGFHVEATEPGILASFLGNGNTHHDIGMVQITDGEDRVGRDGSVLIAKEISGKTGLFHLGWEMHNESLLVEAIDRLRKTDQAVAFFADHQISHSIYIPDPDGNLHEFYADELKDWRSIFQGELELITGVWNPGDKEPHADPRYDPNPRLYGVDDAPLHPLRITHCAFVVSNVKRAMHFYEHVAGLNKVHVADDDSYAIFEGDMGDYNLSIFQAREGEQVGMHHCGFQLADEESLEQSVASLIEDGVHIERQINDINKRSLFLLDHDGIRWEFCVDRAIDYSAIGLADPLDRPYLA
tara:strand:- start:2693 stop:3697 length:1005 start_codon:yes stop_codon:yes gene_type:complete